MMRATASGSWGKLGSFAGWKPVLLGDLGTPQRDFEPARLSGDGRGYSEDLRPLLVVTQRARRALLANRFLGGWLVWLGWVFLGVIVAAAFSRDLKQILIAAALVAGIGAIASGAREWRRRPSAYACAREIDGAAGFSDRLSTALYFGSHGKADPMILRQRRDALRHLERVDARALFPIRVPDFAKGTAVLALIALV